MCLYLSSIGHASSKAPLLSWGCEGCKGRGTGGKPVELARLSDYHNNIQGLLWMVVFSFHEDV